MNVKQLIGKVKEAGGTELHLKISSKPLMRKGRLIRNMDYPAIEVADMVGLLSELLTEDEINKFKKIGIFESNFFGSSPCNFRLSVFHSQQKPVVLIKIIESKIPLLKDLMFPESIASLLDSRKGLLIMTGSPRSGISTSLASLIDRVNQSSSRHILLIEDPIEFIFEQKMSRISQREFRKDIFMIERGINFAKRMDIDILVIGDLKKEIPFKNIIEYVSGGHFVILNMQTLGVSNALEKLIFSFPEADREYICQVLAENLLGVCSQFLLQGGTGKTVPVYEVLINNSTSSSVIQKCKLGQIAHNISSFGAGSESFAQAIQNLVAKRVIDRNTGGDFLDFLNGTKGS